MSDKDTLYARWLDGELSAEEIKSLKASGDWDELEGLLKVTKNLKLPAYNKESSYAKLMSDKGANAPIENPEPHRIKLSTILSAAVSLLLLLGALFFLREEAPDAKANYGETVNYVFADKSSVLLNDGSSIIYDEDTWETTRKVKLIGEAKFDVERGVSFVVETDKGMVEVLGTSFNVRAWDSNLYVECYHGKVKVSANGESAELTKLMSVNVVEGIMDTITSITNESPLWTIGEAVFTQEKLNSVFAELERQYNIKVDRPNYPQKYTGVFSHDDLDKALQQITKPMGLVYDTNEKANHVIISN